MLAFLPLSDSDSGPSFASSLSGVAWPLSYQPFHEHGLRNSTVGARTSTKGDNCITTCREKSTQVHQLLSSQCLCASANCTLYKRLRDCKAVEVRRFRDCCAAIGGYGKLGALNLYREEKACTVPPSEQQHGFTKTSVSPQLFEHLPAGSCW